MSGKLNAGAFEFIPGRSFATPPPQIPTGPPPIERAEQTEAPKPPPTISLNIGGAKPSPSAPTLPPATSFTIGKPPSATVPAPAAPSTILPTAAKPTLSSIQSHGAIPASEVEESTAGSSSNKAFTTERSKTDTQAVEREVIAVADQTVLEDLYGDGMCMQQF